jgi:hypothetical protein
VELAIVPPYRILEQVMHRVLAALPEIIIVRELEHPQVFVALFQISFPTHTQTVRPAEAPTM